MLHATWCLLHRKGRKWVILSVNWNALNGESSSPLLFRHIIVICDRGKSITNHYFFDDGVENQQFPNSSFTAVVCGRRCSIKIDAVGSKRHFHVARGQGQIHNYPSCVGVGKGSDKKLPSVWAGGVFMLFASIFILLCPDIGKFVSPYRTVFSHLSF